MRELRADPEDFLCWSHPRGTKDGAVMSVQAGVLRLLQFGPREALPAETVGMTTKRNGAYGGRTTLASGVARSQRECVPAGRRMRGSPRKRLLTALGGGVSAVGI
jgi:hypothetical protein